ncbi:MAG TPA: GxxExxY protein [Anaerohalosphaeraceae bacterium]|nr:GxxExxY protein [Anaerohalosphaeraceae bacterium]HOL89519.1 GxxExxY protein [Anaerohalosphaeraceae bacterium]HPP57177.1 GxxExxY protein [Anaerohalosphaeraceae bacterium]
MMLYKETTNRILNAAFEVHKHLGCGFLESVYEEALSREFEFQQIPYERQKTLKVFYKETPIKDFVIDFLVDQTVIVEIKAIQNYTDTEIAQVINYLKASKYEVGLLLNFGASSLQYKRLICSKYKNLESV